MFRARLTRYTIILFLSFLILSACKKAGPGGSAGINVHVINGNVNASYSVVHLKYNAKTFPGINATYDEIDTSDYVGRESFTHLKRGHYYIYVEYTDSVTLEVLRGGEYYKIKNGIGETHIVIDLSEEDPY